MPVWEAEVRGGSILLSEHETTGPLPVGFEFERCGSRYDHFDVSTEGFITFSRGPRDRGQPGRVWLVDERARLGGGQVTYEVCGLAPRRRFIVSLAEDGPLGTSLRVEVHERTGIVELSRTDQSFGEPTMRQLDMAHSSPSRANSARNIG